ncbi:MAG TPA: acyltransferase, partial [Aquihabitans sp.]|nr:acyltransferase [Aquihabitans sp.]
MTETVREPRATRPRPPSARRRRRPERRPALRLRRVDGLDGLRVLGALAVVVYHVLGAVLEANPRVGVIMPPAAFTFFIISGFVIYRPFAASHVAGNPPTDLRRYAVGRAIRVLPLWWTALVVYLLVFGTGRLDSPLEWGATLTLTHYAVPGARFAVIGPAWALSVEWIFYLVVPIVAAGIAGAHRALAPRAEAASFQLAGLAAIGAVTAAVADLRPFVAIVVGMALAVVSIRQQQTRRTPA